MAAGQTHVDYSIGEVSKATGVPQSTLRYWETVFPQLKPRKTDGGSRRYSAELIELVRKIDDLLHKKGFTIKGAANFLENDENAKKRETPKSENLTIFDTGTVPEKMPEARTKTAQKKSAPEYDQRALELVLAELHEIRKILEK